VYRPAADDWGRSRAIAAIAAVFAVLAMHGLSCMADSAHAAGIPVIAGASAAHLVGEARPHDCPDCTHHESGPVGELQASTLGAMPMAAATWAGGTEQHGDHGGVPCVAILSGLALLALLAAAATSTGLPVLASDGVWLQLRTRPPTALLCPSLSQLCVLRT